MRVPATKVPLRLPRSSTHADLPSMWKRAWLRDTLGQSSQSADAGSRPAMVSPLASGNVFSPMTSQNRGPSAEAPADSTRSTSAPKA